MAGQIFLPHGSTITFAASDIGGLVSLSLPDETKGEVETTNNDSSGTRTYIPGLRDSGSVTLTCRLISDDVGQAALRTNYAASTTGAVVITLASDAETSGTVTYSFDGFVTALGGDLPQDADEAAMFTATIKVAGAVTKATA